MAGLASLAELRTWRQELASSPARWRSALRITIACSLAAALAQAFHLEQGFWAIVTILVLAPPTVAASLRKASARLGGTIAGCLAAAAAAALFAQQPPLFLAAIVSFLVVTIYFALGTVAPYAFFVSAFTFAIIAYGAVPDPDAAGRMAASRFTEIGLGVIISAASHLLLWPMSMSRMLRRSLSGKLRRATGSIDTVSRIARGESSTPPSVDPPADERLAAQLDLLDQAAGLDDSIHRERDAWSGIIGLLEFGRLSAYECARLAALPPAARGVAALREPIVALADAVARRSGAIADAIERVGGTVDGVGPERDPMVEPPGSPTPTPSPSPGAALVRLDEAFEECRRRGAMQDWSAGELASLAALIQALRSLAVTVEQLPALLADAHGASPQRARVDMRHDALPSLLPLDLDRVRGAVKGAVAATIAIVLGSALHWRLGVPVTATCLVLAVTSSLGSFVQKAGLRMVGTIVGGVIALSVLLWVMPVIDSIASLVVLVAVVTLPCAWLLAGSDRVNYLGLQAAFAFSIGVLGPHRPEIDLWPPTSRMLGVFAGIVIFGLVTLLLWPVRATQQYRRTIGSVLGVVEEIMRDAVAARRPAPFVPFARQRRLYDSIAAAARLLAEAEYEDPRESRLSRVRGLELLAAARRLCRSAILWRQARWSTAGEIPPCESLASLATLGAACGSRLREIAESIAAGAAPTPDASLPPLVAELDAAVDRDRATPAIRAWPGPSLDALLACVEHGRALASEIESLAGLAAALAAARGPARASPLAYAPRAA